MSETFRLSSFLPYRLAVLSERVSRRLSVEYTRTHGLSVAEWRVLVHLLRKSPVSIRDIQTYVNLEKPRVSRAVTRLERDGLVAKAPGAGDGRLVAISLTEAGRAALAEIIPVARDVEAALLAAVSPAELDTFFAVMERMHAALDEDPEAKPRSSMDVEDL
jgi:DNA-binding MarR family transcriptional regulator